MSQHVWCSAEEKAVAACKKPPAKARPRGKSMPAAPTKVFCRMFDFFKACAVSAICSVTSEQHESACFVFS